jgi:aminopeptidase N
LDTRDLRIEKVETSADGKIIKQRNFNSAQADKILGAPLTGSASCERQIGARLLFHKPDGVGVAMARARTNGGQKIAVYVFTGAGIHARSFIPLQDSPQIRVTYSARVRTPKNLLAVMSAEGQFAKQRCARPAITGLR